MSRLLDELHLSIGDATGKVLGVSRGDDGILLAPEDQGRGRDPVDVLLEALVGDGPDELSGAGLSPDEARLRLRARQAVLRQTEEAVGYLALRVHEERPAADIVGQDHPV